MTAIRLTFDVTEGKPKLRFARKLKIPVPPQQKIANMGLGAGVWIEVRDAKGAPLYQRVIDAQALESDTEIRTGRSDRTLTRQKGDKINMVFSAVIPDAPKAVSFLILENPQGKLKRKTLERYKLNLAKISYNDQPKEK